MRNRKLVLVAMAIAIAIGFHVCQCIVQQVESSVRGGHAATQGRNPLVTFVKRLIEFDWDDEPGRITGLVVDSAHVPIGGASVTLDAARTTTTAADGTFAFEDTEPADHTITAEKGDEYGEVTGDDNHPTIELKGGPHVVIHVVDETGALIAGAKVSGMSTGVKITDGAGVLYGEVSGQFRQHPDRRRSRRLRHAGPADRWMWTIPGADDRASHRAPATRAPTAASSSTRTAIRSATRPCVAPRASASTYLATCTGRSSTLTAHGAWCPASRLAR